MKHNGNGDIPSSGDPRVDAALERIRGKFRDLEDAMIVQAHLEKHLDEQRREHAEWLRDHQSVLRTHQDWLKRHDLAMQEFDGKLNALIDMHEMHEGSLKASIENHERAMARHDLAMQEIDGKLNALIDIVDRRQRGESR